MKGKAKDVLPIGKDAGDKEVLAEMKAMYGDRDPRYLAERKRLRERDAGVIAERKQLYGAKDPRVRKTEDVLPITAKDRVLGKGAVGDESAASAAWYDMKSAAREKVLLQNGISPSQASMWSGEFSWMKLPNHVMAAFAKTHGAKAKDVLPITAKDAGWNDPPSTVRKGPHVMTSAALRTPEAVAAAYRPVDPAGFKKSFGKDYTSDHEYGGYRLVMRNGAWVLYGENSGDPAIVGTYKTEAQGLSMLRQKAGPRANDVLPIGKDSDQPLFKQGDAVRLHGRGETGVVAENTWEAGPLSVYPDNNPNQTYWHTSKVSDIPHSERRGRYAKDGTAAGRVKDEDWAAQVDVLAKNVKDKVRELKADGVVGMGRRNFRQVVSTRGVTVAPGAFDRLLDEAIKKAGVSKFIYAQANDILPIGKDGAFAKLQGRLEREGESKHEAGAVAAIAGRKKYGAAGMAKKAAKDYSDAAQKPLYKAKLAWQDRRFNDCIDAAHDAIVAGADGEDLREAQAYLAASKRMGVVKAKKAAAGRARDEVLPVEVS